MSPSVGSSAEAEGPVWSAAASGRVTYWARFAAPAREAVAQAAGIEAGISVLDVGCGSGEFCELAAARGAGVSGIDAAGLIEFARRRLPGGGPSRRPDLSPPLFSSICHFPQLLGPATAAICPLTTIQARWPSRRVIVSKAPLLRSACSVEAYPSLIRTRPGGCRSRGR